MNANQFLIQKNIVYIFLGIFIMILLAGLYFGTVKLQENLELKIFNISTKDTISIANNISNDIKNVVVEEKNKSLLESFKQNREIKELIENKINIFLTKDIKYAYLLYLDKHKIFRFLADASKGDDKAYIGQKFDVYSDEWIDIFDKKEPVIIKNEFSKELSITYLVPIVKESAKMLFVVDFSIKKVENINSVMSKIQYTILLIIIILFLLIFIIIFQSIKYYKSKKNIYIDKLTKLYNRNYLQDQTNFINLNNYILAIIDIDHFKKINDTFGHLAGDKILKELSSIMSMCIRTNEDILIRYGGEEFCLLIKKERNSTNLGVNLLERIMSEIKNREFIISDEETINLTISIGVNLIPSEHRDFLSAFKMADIALYNAKNRGRDRMEFYNELTQDNTLLSINEIKDAIYEKRVISFFQPIVDINSSKISHYEALVRIVGKDQNIITPDKFLSVTKGTFISRNITKAMLSICIRMISKYKNMKLNINLTPQDLTNDTILDILKNLAKNQDISNNLGLEIVESEEIINLEQSKKNILMLKELGYKIYIDDFGSGYSNFIYLSEIEADYIKIDGSIIKNIIKDKTSYLVAKSIINFAKEANIKTIAEFVYSQEIYDFVKDMGVDQCQGYHISKPLDIEDIDKRGYGS